MPPRSTLSRPATHAAFGTARLLTGHARRHYESRYKGRHHRPRLVFAIDGTLVAIVLALLGFLTWIMLLPVPQSGIRLTFAAPPLRTAAPTPIAATFRVTDARPHENVRVRWHLPPGSEILSAEPPLTSDGVAFLGTLAPNEERTIRVVARLLIPEHQSALFGFTLIHEEGGRTQEFFGEATRPVTGTGLFATMPAEFQVERVSPMGARLPIRIENATTETVPFARLRLIRPRTEPGEQVIDLGTLQPNEIRWVYVDVPPPDPEHPERVAWVNWKVGAAARDLSEGFWQAQYNHDATFPTIQGTLRSRTSAPTTLSLSSPADLLIVHPLLQEPIQRVAATEERSITIPAITTTKSPTHEWFVAPLINSTLGPATMGTIQTALPFATTIRYTASTGDQLGAGPLPPRVGLETRYWVFWTVGPIDSELEQITVHTTLPQGVTATGNFTAADGGSAQVSNRTVSWTLPLLGTDHARATFGFEISVTPTAEDLGNVLTLLGPVTATAEDTHTSLLLDATTDPLYSTLPEFTNDYNGIVAE